VLLATAATATTGGGEKHVADLLRLLTARGLEVGLVSPPGGDLAELTRELRVRQFEAEIESGFSPAAITATRRAIASFDPDVVHAHGSRAAAFVRLADPRARDRVVYTLHGIHIDKAGSKARQVAFRSLERFLKPRTARFITVAKSDTAKGALLGILDEARTQTVYNGIELPGSVPPRGAFRAELGIAEKTPLAVCIGRFHEQKDHATLLTAFSVLRAQTVEPELVLLGGGPLEQAVRDRVDELGLSAAVHFAPPRHGIAQVYADADVLVLSSLWEGLPYVVIEAMSYGLPVVSTDVDGIPEAVEDEVTGLLVKPRDVHALAAALVRLLRDPELGRRMGEAGRALVAEKFGLDRMADELVAVYEDVARDRVAGIR
jgi:glycosyltransferase involved in cell wall biosynthesis